MLKDSKKSKVIKRKSLPVGRRVKSFLVSRKACLLGRISTLKDILNFKKNTVGKIINSIILTLSLAMGVYFQWGVMEILIFLIFISIILYPIESRFLAIPALLFLIPVPFFLIFKNKENNFDMLAEQSAIYVYYFLVMAVIMGIYEVRKGR